MKIKITAPDTNGHAVGDIVDVDGDTMPGWAVNKAEPVEAKRVAVTNPAKPKDEKPKGDEEKADD